MNSIASCKERSPAKSIAILTAVSLAWNPRPVKEAMALARAGFDVVVYGASPDHGRLKIDERIARQNGFAFKSVAPISQIELFRRIQSVWQRLRCRLGIELFKVVGMQNRWQLGLYTSELLKQARKVNADYYIVHLEQAAWVGVRLLNEGYRVGVDMEDWHSEDLPDARKQRPLRLLRDLERNLLIRGAHATCPSAAMSAALANEYKCPPPTVVYNAFQWSDRSAVDGLRKDRLSRKATSIHWFSQTLGSDRGLEDLLGALPNLKHNAEIHLRGNRDIRFERWLATRTPSDWRDRIFVHDVVANDELLSRIAEHDIGLAAEMTFCRSRDLTVTNKILYYLLAGLAVVASDTAGQREIALKAPKAVSLYTSGDALALCAQLNRLLESREQLDVAKAAARQSAEELFCWERQENVFLETITHSTCNTKSRIRT